MPGACSSCRPGGAGGHGPHLPGAARRSSASCPGRGGRLAAMWGQREEAGGLGLPASPSPPGATPRGSPSVPQPPTPQSLAPSATLTQEAMQPDAHSTPSQPVAHLRPPCLSAPLPCESWPQKYPQPRLTPVRANNQLGHLECEDAAWGDGDRLPLAQVALALALKDGYGLRTRHWVVGPGVGWVLVARVCRGAPPSCLPGPCPLQDLRHTCKPTAPGNTNWPEPSCLWVRVTSTSFCVCSTSVTTNTSTPRFRSCCRILCSGCRRRLCGVGAQAAYGGALPQPGPQH